MEDSAELSRVAVDTSSAGRVDAQSLSQRLSGLLQGQLMQSPRQLQSEGALRELPRNWPPKLCNVVSVPQGETSFAINISKLEQCASTVDIVDLSGQTSLFATVQNDAITGRAMTSISTKQEGMLGAMLSAAPGSPASLMMEIKGRNGHHFGELRATGEFSFILTCCGEAMLDVQIISSSGVLTIDLLPNCERWGAASVDEEQNGTEQLLVQVSAGADVILVLLCVVGVLVFASAAETPPRSTTPLD